VQDASKLEVVSLSYYKLSKKFGIKVKNTGKVTAFADAELPDVSIAGITKTLRYEGVKEVEPGK